MEFLHALGQHIRQPLLGGLDERLKRELALAFVAKGLSVLTDGHVFPGREPLNVCNRTKSGKGVQIELSARWRGVGESSGWSRR